MTCNGQTYAIDDNLNYTYRVALDALKFTGVQSNTLSFQYGNDIDHTAPARSDLEVYATAKGNPSSCFTEYPTIVRYIK